MEKIEFLNTDDIIFTKNMGKIIDEENNVKTEYCIDLNREFAVIKDFVNIEFQYNSKE